MPRVLFPPLFCLFQSNVIDAQKNIKGPFFFGYAKEYKRSFVFLGRKRIKSWKTAIGMYLSF